MSEPVEMPALLTVFGASPASATVTVMPLGIGHRLARALGALLTCWGAAVVAVFIPVAHFLLVPGRPWRDWSGLSSGFARATGSGRRAAESIVSAPLMRPR